MSAKPSAHSSKRHRIALGAVMAGVLGCGGADTHGQGGNGGGGNGSTSSASSSTSSTSSSSTGGAHQGGGGAGGSGLGGGGSPGTGGTSGGGGNASTGGAGGGTGGQGGATSSSSASATSSSASASSVSVSSVSASSASASSTVASSVSASASSSDAASTGTGMGGGDVVNFVSGVQVTTLDGSGTRSEDDGDPTMATFANPVNLTVDPMDGDLVICDFDGSEIRLATPTGDVSTLFFGEAGFTRPFGVTLTETGELYVETDWNDLGANGPTDGTIWKIDRTTSTATVVVRSIGRPRGIVALPSGSLVLSDLHDHTLRILDPVTKVITPLAGSPGNAGYVDNADGSVARFDQPYGVALMPDGSVLVADQNNHRLRQVTLAGAVTTYAGTGAVGVVDGPRLSARFDLPQAVAVDAVTGNVFVSDVGNHRIRMIDGSGTAFTLAGDGVAGWSDTIGANAEFFGQEGIALSPSGGIVYVADGNGGDAAQPYNRIRAVLLP